MKFKIERMGSDGEGIAYYNKQPVYIYYAYLGEEVNANLFTNKRGVYEAELVDVIKPSPKRREVTWPYYMKSGSVNLLHVDYAEQLKYKRDVVKFLLVTRLKNETSKTKLESTVGADHEFYYRNKSYIPLVNFDGKNQMSNYLRGSNRLFPIGELIVENKIIEKTILDIFPIMDYHKVNAYNPKSKRGSVISLLIRANKKDEVQLTFVTKVKVNLTPLINEISKKYKNIVSIYENYVPNFKNSPDIYEGELKLLSGDKYLTMYVNDYKFFSTPFAFFQLNTSQAEKLYNLVIEKANFTKDDVVLDAYCGIGTIATHVSKHVKRVVAIESIKAAVNDMDYSLEANNIKNVKTITGDFVKIIDYLKDDFDKMIFNPPRIGLGNEVCHYILKKAPKQVVYVSCNPKTLMSDLKILSEKYDIKSITPFDMFPQTSQIENIVILNFKNN